MLSTLSKGCSGAEVQGFSIDICQMLEVITCRYKEVAALLRYRSESVHCSWLGKTKSIVSLKLNLFTSIAKQAYSLD